jgi:hypothetical protein
VTTQKKAIERLRAALSAYEDARDVARALLVVAPRADLEQALSFLEELDRPARLALEQVSQGTATIEDIGFAWSSASLLHRRVELLRVRCGAYAAPPQGAA